MRHQEMKGVIWIFEVLGDLKLAFGRGNHAGYDLLENADDRWLYSIIVKSARFDVRT
jgi:hypothetical protein